MEAKRCVALLSSILCVFVCFVMNVAAQLQSSPWPMYAHDLRHTGQSQYASTLIPGLKWSYRMEETSAPSVDSSGRIYICSADNNLYCMNSDGSLAWNYPTNDDILSAPAIDFNGRIYFAAGKTKLYTLNSNGSLLWTYTYNSSTAIESSPAIGTGGEIYLCGNAFHGLSRWESSGTLSWSYRASGTYASSPAVNSGGRIIFVAGASTLAQTCLNSNGSLCWSYQGGATSFVSASIGSGGEVY